MSYRSQEVGSLFSGASSCILKNFMHYFTVRIIAQLHFVYICVVIQYFQCAKTNTYVQVDSRVFKQIASRRIG